MEVNMPGPMSYRSVYKTYQHLLTQEAENNTDQFLRGEHDLLEYQRVRPVSLVYTSMIGICLKQKKCKIVKTVKYALRYHP